MTKIAPLYSERSQADARFKQAYENDSSGGNLKRCGEVETS
jgi:hypothetical protein